MSRAGVEPGTPEEIKEKSVTQCKIRQGTQNPHVYFSYGTTAHV
jgi:hypothetical protein